jgi:hypothetical protein
MADFIRVLKHATISACLALVEKTAQGYGSSVSAKLARLHVFDPRQRRDLERA